LKGWNDFRRTRVDARARLFHCRNPQRKFYVARCTRPAIPPDKQMCRESSLAKCDRFRRYFALRGGRLVTLRHILAAFLCAAAAAVIARPAAAGPPYITDDPEPTDTGHWENYLYVEGTRALGAFDAPGVGIEVNYGALPDTQLTWSVPLTPNPGPGGMGVVWAPLGGGVKYRFIEEDENGWRPQVALFPQIFIPFGAASRTESTTELLPLWLQKSFGPWTSFGGGGIMNNPGAGNRDYAIYGWALQRDVTSALQMGVEIFGQTRSGVGFGASDAAGLAAIYDFSDRWHLVGSLNTGFVNAREADRYSYNLALKWTP
jgi:hypothetical protein